MYKRQILKTLSNFIAIQSVSTDSTRFGEIKKAVTFLTEKLENIGFTVKSIGREKAPPLIVAHRDVAGAKKTIGIYGHYDVQPEDPVNEWKTSPFTLTQKDGLLLGRGVADNKGHVIQNLTAIESLIKENKLSNNIVFVLEGEEETGSAHFSDFVEDSDIRPLLDTVDVFYVTDVGMHAKNEPQIFYALRGLLYFQLQVTIGERDLHSGIYGNRVLNPIQVLSDVMSKVKNIQNGEVQIPGFYDDVRSIGGEEMSMIRKTVRSDEEEKKEANVYKVVSLKGIAPTLATKLYPSFDIHGMWGGYMGEGQKTVIPRTAFAKFSFRLVGHQEPNKIEKMVQNYIKEIMPDGVKYELTTLSKEGAFYTGIDDSHMKKTVEILEKEFGVKPLFNLSGGSIPASAILQNLTHKPVILTGFTLPNDNIHSPNENFDEDMFWKGIDVLKKLYSSL